MSSIGWVEIHLRKYGGIIYNEQARHALSKAGFDVELVDASAKIFRFFSYLKIPESLLRTFFLKGEKSVWIRDFYSTLTLPFDRTRGKQIVLVHHLDFSGMPGLRFLIQPAFSLTTKLFYRNLKKADAIVVVSEYWKEHFEDRGYRNVRVIYNAFDLSQFDILDAEVEAFKKKYGFETKPVIYLGNCQAIKGVIEAYRELKGLDAHFVTSGKQEVKLPAKNLELSHREYLTLLKASDIVLAMSKMLEGWNRTAHEAMLLKRPVIGSGLGGMEELLSGGKQIVCGDFPRLRERVEFLLENPEIRKTMGERGYQFAKDFSCERFDRAWTDCIKSIV